MDQRERLQEVNDIVGVTLIQGGRRISEMGIGGRAQVDGFDWRNSIFKIVDGYRSWWGNVLDKGTSKNSVTADQQESPSARAFMASSDTEKRDI